MWHTFIRQALLKGFLNRLLVVGSGHNMITDIVFATYTVADAGTELLFIWPEDTCTEDKRRWLTGLVRTGNMQ